MIVVAFLIVLFGWGAFCSALGDKYGRTPVVAGVTWAGFAGIALAIALLP